MKIGVTEASPRAIQRAAEKKFKGGYYCCEALISAIREEFKLDVPEEVIAMASGMAVGAGKSGCICGAFNGGILALGMFFGRTGQNGPTDPKSHIGTILNSSISGLVYFLSILNLLQAY